MTELLNFINLFQKLDEETEAAIKGHFREEVYRKGEFLVEEGKVCTKINFIKSGLK